MNPQRPSPPASPSREEPSSTRARARAAEAVAEGVTERFDAGRAKWPDVELDPGVFAAHLARHAKEELPPLAHAADLYLACACAGGVRAALAAFERSFAADVARAVRRIDASRDFAAEVAQVLRAKLLVGDAPKIAEYAGRSSLRAWISASATRTALNLRRNKDDRGHAALDSRVHAIAGDDGGELAHIKRRYGAKFDRALRVALGRLDAQHRALLRLHFVEKVSLERLAALYHVSRATIARRIATARGALVDDTQRELRTELRVSDSELVSLTAFVMSALEVSVMRLLEDGEE